MRTRARFWGPSILCLGALVGCTSGNSDDGAVTTTTAASPETTSTTEQVVLPVPDVTTTTSELTDLGRSATSVFDSGIAGGFELVELEGDAARAVREQFTTDERLDDVLVDVDVRLVRRDGADAAVLASLALSPSVALSESWRADFEAGVTGEAVGAPVDVRIGTETLLSFSTPGESVDQPVENLLWRTDNVVVLASGRDEQLVNDVAFSLLEVLVGPIPTTTTAPPTTVAE